MHALVWDETAKRILVFMIKSLRLLLLGATLFYVAIEIEEVMAAKDIESIAMFAIFFLIANLQIGISRLMLNMNEDEHSQKLFLISIFMITAAFLEIVDAGFDKGLAYLSNTQNISLYKVLSSTEFIICVAAVALAYYSLDRFFVQLKFIVNQLKPVKI